MAGVETETTFTGTLLAMRKFPPVSVDMLGSSGIAAVTKLVLDTNPNPEGFDALVGPKRSYL